MGRPFGSVLELKINGVSNERTIWWQKKGYTSMLSMSRTWSTYFIPLFFSNKLSPPMQVFFWHKRHIFITSSILNGCTGYRSSRCHCGNILNPWGYCTGRLNQNVNKNISTSCSATAVRKGVYFVVVSSCKCPPDSKRLLYDPWFYVWINTIKRIRINR